MKTTIACGGAFLREGEVTAGDAITSRDEGGATVSEVAERKRARARARS